MELFNLIAMAITSLQGLFVIVPCAIMELILITALIECYNKKDYEGGKLMITLMKVVISVPLIWLVLVLLIGLA